MAAATVRIQKSVRQSPPAAPDQAAQQVGDHGADTHGENDHAHGPAHGLSPPVAGDDADGEGLYRHGDPLDHPAGDEEGKIRRESRHDAADQQQAERHPEHPPVADDSAQGRGHPARPRRDDVEARHGPDDLVDRSPELLRQRHELREQADTGDVHQDRRQHQRADYQPAVTAERGTAFWSDGGRPPRAGHAATSAGRTTRSSTAHYASSSSVRLMTSSCMSLWSSTK